MAQRLVHYSISLISRFHLLWLRFPSRRSRARCHRNHAASPAEGGAIAKPLRTVWPVFATFILALSVNCGGDDSGSSSDPGDTPAGPAQDLPDGLGTLGMDLGDLNGDGLIDLVITNPNSNSATSLLGDGHGGFSFYRANPVILETAELYRGGIRRSVAVTLGDFNNDGHVDALVANAIAHNFSVMLGDGTGKLGACVGAWVPPNDPETGHPDMGNCAYTHPRVDGGARTTPPDDFPGMRTKLRRPMTKYYITSPRTLLLHDLNQDGWLDVIQSNNGTGLEEAHAIGVWMGTG